MRYSALGVIQAMSDQEISHHKKDGIDLVSEASMRNHHIEFIPISPHDEIVETIIASKCVDAAISDMLGTLKRCLYTDGYDVSSSR